MRKFLSQTPRWVNFAQLVLGSVASVAGTLATAGVVINPVVGVVVAVGTSITGALLQFLEKKN